MIDFFDTTFATQGKQKKMRYTPLLLLCLALALVYFRGGQIADFYWLNLFQVVKNVWLYFPNWTVAGGHQGLNESDVCVKLTGIPSSHFERNPDACSDAISRVVNGYTLMVHYLVIIVATILGVRWFEKIIFFADPTPTPPAITVNIPPPHPTPTSPPSRRPSSRSRRDGELTPHQKGQVSSACVQLAVNLVAAARSDCDLTCAQFLLSHRPPALLDQYNHPRPSSLPGAGAIKDE